MLWVAVALGLEAEQCDHSTLFQPAELPIFGDDFSGLLWDVMLAFEGRIRSKLAGGTKREAAQL